MKKIVKILAGCLILLMFLPTCGISFYGNRIASFSAARAMIGYSYKHSQVIPGNFWIVLLIIIPIVILGAVCTSGSAAEYTAIGATICDFIGWIIYGNHVSKFLVEKQFLYYVVLVICVAIAIMMLYIHFNDVGSIHTNVSNSSSYFANSSLSNGKWECLRCGSLNIALSEYCTECGEKRRGFAIPGTTSSFEKKNTDLVEGSNAWRCAFCNNLTPNNIGFCKCGASRGDTKKKLEERKIQENAQTQVNIGKEDSTHVNLQDELKKYKELLEENLITQEDYDKKKSELLKL